MTAPARVPYHGETISLVQLHKRTQIPYSTLIYWHANGLLSEAVVDEHAVVLALRRKALANGVSKRALRDRIRDGWSEERAATTPMMRKGRRARA